MSNRQCVAKDAIISECGQYRYELTRRWGDGRMCCFVGLNPSTADAQVDDPTIRKCIGFAKQWRFDGIRMVNLFALRETSPEMMNDRRHAYAQLGDHILLAPRIRGDAKGCVTCPHCGIGQLRRKEGSVCAYCGAEVVGMWTVEERQSINKQMHLELGI